MFLVSTRRFISPLVLVVTLFVGWRCCAGAEQLPPNFIVIFVDDLGYADIGPFGSAVNRTPHLDRMAAEGRKFTNFYVAAAVCTPSRAALMTGCYAQRVDMALNALPGTDAEQRTVR